MKPEDALTIMQLTQPLATLEHARAFLAVAADRGLTPFQEIWPIFSEQREKHGTQWVTVGIKGLTFKEHYSVQNRWSQKSGGYSVPYRVTARVTRENAYGKQEPGVEVTVGVLTNRDYAALAQMATLRLPGWDFIEERKAFLQYATAFVPDSHRPPSGWSVEDVARKRAEEQALKKAFGKEPSQSREIYGNVLTATEARETAALLFHETPREALPAPAKAIQPAPQFIEGFIEGNYAEEPEPDPAPDFDDAQLDADIAHAGEVAAYPHIVAAGFGVFDTQKGGNLHIGFIAEGDTWPTVRWWNGRTELIKAAPWIGELATKEELGVLGARWDCRMNVYYEVNERGYKTAVRFELLDI